MPLKIRWSSKEYSGIVLMLFGVCGLYQTLIIFIAIFLLSVGNYLAIIIIPIGGTLALFYGSMITFESFAQVERKERLRSQFRKSRSKKHPKLMAFLDFPVVRPLLIMIITFSIFFFISYAICNAFLDNVLSFIISEFVSVLFCLLIANFLERNYAKVQRV